MKYSNMTTNEQRLHIAAYGFEQAVVPDYYNVREAIKMKDLVATRFGDPAKATLAFAVFLKAAQMAHLRPKHIIQWVGSSWEGTEAIRQYAADELGIGQARKGNRQP